MADLCEMTLIHVVQAHFSVHIAGRIFPPHPSSIKSLDLVCMKELDKKVCMCVSTLSAYHGVAGVWMPIFGCICEKWRTDCMPSYM